MYQIYRPNCQTQPLYRNNTNNKDERALLPFLVGAAIGLPIGLIASGNRQPYYQPMPYYPQPMPYYPQQPFYPNYGYNNFGY